MSALQADTHQGGAGLLEPLRLVRLYVLALGAGLLAEGGALLLVNAVALPLAIGTNDTRHNLLHVVWGSALLAIAATARQRQSTRAAWAALVFGAFYVTLGVLGVLIDRPFGLLLGPGENAFHFIVGPVALVLGARALLELGQGSQTPQRRSTPTALR